MVPISQRKAKANNQERDKYNTANGKRRLFILTHFKNVKRIFFFKKKNINQKNTTKKVL